MRTLLRAGLGMCLTAAIAGCSAEALTGPGTERVVDGTVEWLDLEGGFYAIHANGTNYDPIDLPESFRQDGLDVRAKLRLRDDMGSIHMVGPVVNVLEIRRR